MDKIFHGIHKGKCDGKKKIRLFQVAVLVIVGSLRAGGGGGAGTGGGGGGLVQFHCGHCVNSSMLKNISSTINENRLQVFTLELISQGL